MYQIGAVLLCPSVYRHCRHCLAQRLQHLQPCQEQYLSWHLWDVYLMWPLDLRPVEVEVVFLCGQGHPWVAFSYVDWATAFQRT